MPDEDAKRVCLGRAVGARGLKGEVRIKTFTQDPRAIANYGPLEDETGARHFEILKFQVVKDGVVAQLKGVTSRAAAQALKGLEFWIGREKLPEMEDGSTFPPRRVVAS